MERLLKLMDHRNSVGQSREGADSIFDIKAYQKAFQQHACATSFDKASSPYKRLSFSEYSNYPKREDRSLKGHSKIIVKEEIKAHQSKVHEKKVSDMIKQKLKKAKLPKVESQKDNMSEGQDKKVFHSAYIMARKKIFQKQHYITAKSQLDFSHIPVRDRKQSMSEKEIEQSQKELMVVVKPKSFVPELQQEKQSRNKSDEGSEEQVQTRRNIKYLQKMISVNRRNAQAKPEELNLTASKLLGREISNTPTIKRGFITVMKKRKSIFNLVARNPVMSPRKREAKTKVEDTEQSGMMAYLKNFVNQKQLDQEQIDLFPQTEKIHFKKEAYLSGSQFQQITSRSVSILHVREGELLTALAINERERVEIASITKIMTCFLVLTIADRFCLDISKEKVIVSDKASKMQGTTAKLTYSDSCSVYQMLHGLMLPSGNDAAIVLGEWGGKVIRKYAGLLKKMRPTESTEKSDKSLNFLQNYGCKRKSHVRLFVHHMNKMAKFLQLRNTQFANTHGLMNGKAHSSSQDVMLLTFYAMKNSFFKEIASRKSFQCRMFNRTFSHFKEVTWDNTNKLLGIEGFSGVKTGVTPSAGPCLSSLFEVSPNQYFIVVILRTKSCELRFKETVYLLKTILKSLSVSELSGSRYGLCLQNLQKYDRLQMDKGSEMLNDCGQSLTSEEEQLQMDNFML